MGAEIQGAMEKEQNRERGREKGIWRERERESEEREVKEKQREVREEKAGMMQIQRSWRIFVLVVVGGCFKVDVVVKVHLAERHITTLLLRLVNPVHRHDFAGGGG